jgi:predicted Fe-Mo cluster-binding NifX family protein
MDPRFGRCQYFVFVDPESMEFEAFENEGLMASGGAGVQAAQLVVQKGAKALVTGNLGPNAASALSASGIKVHLAAGGSVKEVTEAFKTGKLREVSGSTVPSHFGMGGGRGMGRGR